MRKVVVSEFITVDGYIVGPDEDVSWVIDGFDTAMHNDLAEAMSESFDLYVFGRVTYDIFAPYWPHALPYEPGDERSVSAGKEDPRIIRALNETPKLVFSTTLEKAEWQNTRLLRGGVEDEIRRLKSEPGKSIDPGQHHHRPGAPASGPRRRIQPVRASRRPGRRQAPLR
jgi:dihydrofolate reductase